MKHKPIVLRNPLGQKIIIEDAGIIQHQHATVINIKLENGNEFQLCGDARIMATTLIKLGREVGRTHPPNPIIRQALYQNKPDSMVITPTQLRELYANSPTLRPHLADVESFIKGYFFVDDETAPAQNDVQTVLAQMEPAALFKRDGTPRRGAQTRIAEALDIPNAGSYRERIFQTLEQIRGQFYSTTAPQTVEIAQNVA